MICMFQLRVHCGGIIRMIACYGISTNISDCDCQHRISYCHIYHLRLSISGMYRFCWVNFSLRFFSWVQFMVSLIGEFAVLKRFAPNFGMDLQLEFGTWNLYWDLDLQLGTWTGTHISVMVKTCSFITATLASNY